MIKNVTSSLSPTSIQSEMNWGESALRAPVTPGKKIPVVDRSKVNPEMIKAAEGMETMFIDYMMKTMRQTIPKNEMDLESPATEIYRSMLDSEYAQKASAHGGIGLADQIIAYLDSQGYNIYKEENGASKSAGNNGGIVSPREKGNGVPIKEKP